MPFQFSALFFLLFSIAAIAEDETNLSDKVSLSLQDESTVQLVALAKKYRGTPQEAPLLFRLLDSQELSANLEFRVAHAKAYSSNQKANLAAYERKLKALKVTVDQLISKYPNHQSIDRAYFVRAEATRELNLNSDSMRDFVVITQNFPKSSYAIRASLALAAFAVKDRKYAKAIEHLKRVETEPGDSHYPFALHQIAWAYFNLSEIPTAIGYLKRNIEFYNRKAQANESKTLSASDEAFREQSLRDIVSFYYEGMEKGLDGYRMNEALPTFRKFENGPLLGKMSLSFAKLLRSREREGDLTYWTSLILDEEYSRAETFDIWKIYYEYLIVHGKWDQLLNAIKEFKELVQKTDFRNQEIDSKTTALSLLLSGAEQLQKNFDNSQNHKAKETLANIYEIYLALAPSNDPHMAKIHYNLAETYFGLKRYKPSTKEYTWILDHWAPSFKLTQTEIQIKRISSRYQELVQSGQLSKDVEPSPLKGEKEADFSQLSSEAKEWSQWIANFPPASNSNDPIVNFEFELNRLLYISGQTSASLQRMLAFVQKNPSSELAVPAANLVLDTLVFNQKWQEIFDTATTLKKYPINNPNFFTRLNNLPYETQYKMIELNYQAQEYQKVIEQTEKFTSSQSPLVANSLLLASRSAQKLNDNSKAKFFLQTLIARFPNHDQKAIATLNQATLQEADYDTGSAAQSYNAYLAQGKISEKERQELTKRYWFLNWISKEPQAINCTSYRTGSKMESECSQFQALVALEKPRLAPNRDTILKKAKSGPVGNRVLWAALALKMKLKLKPKENLKFSLLLSQQSKDLDPLIQLTLIPELNRIVPEVFRQTRVQISKAAPLKGNSRSITKRIEKIRDLEQAAGEMVNSPWAQIKVTTLNEVAQAYLDFCADLSRLKVPKGLNHTEKAEYEKSIAEISGPFKAKGQTLQNQGKTLLANTPIPLTRNLARNIASRSEAFDISLLDKLSPESKPWLSVSTGSEKSERLRAFWADAFRTQHWPRMAYFFQEIKNKAGLKDTTLALMRVLTLASAGAQTEALADLEAVIPQLGENERKIASRVLFTFYLNSSAAEKAKHFEERQKD